MASNESQAHAFYYYGVNEGESKSYVGCRISYDRNIAYSYSTCVAKVIPAKGFKQSAVNTSRPGSGITLISFENMSATTARHISQLHYASPFPVVYVPMKYGRANISPAEMANLFVKELEYCLDNSNLIKYRRDFVTLMNSRRKIIDGACTEWAKALKGPRFRKYDSLDITKHANELKEHNRKLVAKQLATMRAVLKKYAKGSSQDYLSFVRAVLEHGAQYSHLGISPEERGRISQALTAGGRSYVWVDTDGESVRTSRGIRVPVQEARVLLKAWGAGDDMRTRRIGMYSILQYSGSEIKIGCHAIPRENMVALYEVLVGKPFPGNRTAPEDKGKES